MAGWIATRQIYSNSLFTRASTLYSYTRPLLYLDPNNLYGKAMLDPLPSWGFRYLTEEETEALDTLFPLIFGPL